MERDALQMCSQPSEWPYRNWEHNVYTDETSGDMWYDMEDPSGGDDLYLGLLLSGEEVCPQCGRLPYYCNDTNQDDGDNDGDDDDNAAPNRSEHLFFVQVLAVICALMLAQRV